MTPPEVHASSLRTPPIILQQPIGYGRGKATERGQYYTKGVSQKDRGYKMDNVKTEAIELAEHLLDEFGDERAQLIAWEMYTASVISRGELFTIKRVLKNIA